MKKLSLVMVIFSLVAATLLSGCFANTNVKRIDKKDGESIVILKDETAKPAKSNSAYANKAEEIKETTSGKAAFYISKDDLLVIRELPQDKQDIVVLQNLGGPMFETKLLTEISGKYFQISPDAKKLMYVDASSKISVLELPELPQLPQLQQGQRAPKPVCLAFDPSESLLVKKLRYMDKENIFLEYSAGWGSTDNIVFSDRHGAIYTVRYPTDLSVSAAGTAGTSGTGTVTGTSGTDASSTSTNAAFSTSTAKAKAMSIDSTYKTDIKIVAGKLIYMKRDSLRIAELGLKQGNYPGGNYLSFSDRDNMSDIIVEPSDSLNLMQYELSPDNTQIALYFENKKNEGALFIADIRSTAGGKSELFTKNILYRNMIHISGQRISDMQWSKDSQKLAYSTAEGSPGLYAVNADGTDNSLLLGDKLITGLDWGSQSDRIMGTASGTVTQVYLAKR